MSKGCVKSPFKNCFCVQGYVLRLMKLDKSILEGVVPVVIDRKRLSHPNQPSHINGGDDVRVFNGSCERRQSVRGPSGRYLKGGA